MKYPINIENRVVAYQRRYPDVTENDMKILRICFASFNFAYRLGKDGDHIPADMIMWMQKIATDVGAYEFSFALMRSVSEAHAQGRRDAGEQKSGARYG